MQLTLDNAVYSLEAVQKACYRFIDRFSAVISKDSEKVIIDLTIDTKNIADTDHIVADFYKELLDQNLRLKIKNETESVRNLILAYAFSNTGLQG